MRYRIINAILYSTTFLNKCQVQVCEIILYISEVQNGYLQRAE